MSLTRPLHGQTPAARPAQATAVASPPAASAKAGGTARSSGDVGRWEPLPLTFISLAEEEPGVAAAGAGQFFWVDQDSGALWAFDPAAPAPRRPGQSRGFPTSLVVGPKRLHWVEREYRALGTLDLAATSNAPSPTYMPLEMHFPIAMVAHGEDLIVASLGASDGDGCISRVRNEQAEILQPNLRRPVAVAVDSQSVGKRTM